MDVKVDDDLCIACGSCIEICPEVFGWNHNESLAEVKVSPVPGEAEDCAKEAIDICPTDAIEEE